MTVRLFPIDFETRSPLDLTVVGVARYVEDPDTDVWCMAYSPTDRIEDVQCWEREDLVMPAALAEAVEEGAFIRAWNAPFEYHIWNCIMVPKYGWPPLPIERFVCAMAMAAAAALPLSLDKAAIALGLQERKDHDGYKNMLRMAKPRGRAADGSYIWWDEPERRAVQTGYCTQDVRTEIAAWQHTPPSMDRRERAIWLADQRINNRGIQLDLPLIRAAHRLVAEVQPKLDQEIAAATDGLKVTQVAKLKDWFTAQGVELDSLNKATVAATLERDDLTPEIRAVLEARQGGAKSSTAKFGTMLRAVCADGRVRGTMQYYGATTGRWAGRGVQPHNNPIPKRKVTGPILLDIQQFEARTIELLHGPVLPLLSDILRTTFIARPGKKLAVADYSTIEARIVAWLAGQDDLIEDFRNNAPVYEAFAAEAYKIALAEILQYKIDHGDHHPARQGGKIGILGCGFGMGWERAAEQYGIERKLARTIVNTYRGKYLRIVALWDNINEAANAAVRGRCEVVVPDTGDKLRFELRGEYLLLHLPSGRPLWYHAPEVRTYTVRRMTTVEALDEVTGETIEVEKEISFQATGVEISTLHGVTKQWVRQQMYGGLWTENAVQACARDIMADAILRCEPVPDVDVVLSVHDELVAEVEPDMTSRAFVDLLTVLPEWAAGCPLAAAGWVEERYRK